MTLTNKARYLRTKQTKSERVLWQKLRNRQILNCKFRRQYPITPYIVDFVCLDLKLIIELDGSQHLQQEDHDEKRRLFLEQRGFKVMRFWNNEVYNNIEGVLESIRLAVLEISCGES